MIRATLTLALLVGSAASSNAQDPYVAFPRAYMKQFENDFVRVTAGIADWPAWHDAWRGVQTAYFDFLHTTTLADISHPGRPNVAH